MSDLSFTAVCVLNRPIIYCRLCVELNYNRPLIYCRLCVELNYNRPLIYCRFCVELNYERPIIYCRLCFWQGSSHRTFTAVFVLNWTKTELFRERGQWTLQSIKSSGNNSCEDQCFRKEYYFNTETAWTLQMLIAFIQHYILTVLACNSTWMNSFL